jgi:hypothetical protein
LNATLNMSLSNNGQKTGTAAVDPDTHGVRHAVVIGLAWKACDAAGDAGATDAGSPSDVRDGGGPVIDPRDAGMPFPFPDLDDGGLPVDLFDGGFPFPPPRGSGGGGGGGR